MTFAQEIAQGRFCIPECHTCKKIVWPASDICAFCLGSKVTYKHKDFEGRIIEYSRQDNRYFCLVEFEKTVKVMAEISKEPKIGQLVKIKTCSISNGICKFYVV